MALIATYDKSTRPWKRRTGIYGHLPKFTMHAWDYYGEHTPMFCREKDCEECKKCRRVQFWYPRLTYVGYLVLVTKKRRIMFWYMGNPYRHKIIEVQRDLRDEPSSTG